MGEFAVPAPREPKPKRKKARIRNMDWKKAKLIADRLKAERESKPDPKLLDDAGYYKTEDLKTWFSMWAACPRFGKPVRGTRMLALKTPLATWYELHIDDSSVFTIDMFVERFAVRNKEPIGLLANATWDIDRINYNDKQVYKEWDVQVLSLPMKKQQAQAIYSESTITADLSPLSNPDLIAARLHPPSKEQVNDFIQKVKKVWSEDPLQLVAVCSSFGYNRSGVLIVCFLVEELKLSVESALERFSQSRPPGIYSRPCLEFLKSRFQSGELSIPAAPEWDKISIKLGLASASGQGPKSSDGSATNGASGLPKPWVKQFSKRMKREYYYNPETNKSVWDIKDIRPSST